MGAGKTFLSACLFVAGMFAGVGGAIAVITSIAPLLAALLAALPGWLVGLGLLAISGVAFFGSHKLFGDD